MPNTSLADLTWEDLKAWAGARAVARGKSYRRAVDDLRETADGRLVAWVRGGNRYATVISRDAAGKLTSVCSCPYHAACKHAVAVVLAYLDAVQAGQPVPTADADDERLHSAEEDETEPASSTVTEPATDRYLASLSHADLLELVGQLQADCPGVSEWISNRRELQTGNTAKLVAAARREIRKASAEPGWSNHWSPERQIPDYSRVEQRLEALLAAGHAEEVLQLSEELWRAGRQQIEMSNDEGETGMEIARCMKVVLRALQACDWSGPEKLLWELDLRTEDGYGILDGVPGPMEQPQRFTATDWSAVADTMGERLKLTPQPGGGDDFQKKYRRQQLMRCQLTALQHAGRAGETTGVLEREAEITECYVALVDRLRDEGQTDAAKDWARKGFERTIATSPGIAWALEERLRDVADAEKNAPLAAAYRAREFFRRPDAEHYAALLDAAEAAGCRETVRVLALRWLETGERPDVPAAVKQFAQDKRKPPAASALAWPLPPTGLPEREEQYRQGSFPDTGALIDIAIQEKRNDDVLRWYDLESSRQRFGGGSGEAVADAVQDTHPDAALAIWKRLATAQIALTNPAAYQVAGGFLTKMRTVYQRTSRLEEWQRLLTELRAQHARKPRLLEVLNSLEDRRTRIINR